MFYFHSLHIKNLEDICKKLFLLLYNVMQVQQCLLAAVYMSSAQAEPGQGSFILSAKKIQISSDTFENDGVH